MTVSGVIGAQVYFHSVTFLHAGFSDYYIDLVTVESTSDYTLAVQCMDIQYYMYILIP